MSKHMEMEEKQKNPDPQMLWPGPPASTWSASTRGGDEVPSVAVATRLARGSFSPVQVEFPAFVFVGLVEVPG